MTKQINQFKSLIEPLIAVCKVILAELFRSTQVELVKLKKVIVEVILIDENWHCRL